MWKPRKPYSPEKAAAHLKKLHDAGQKALFDRFLSDMAELADTPDGVSADGLRKRLGVKMTTVSHLSRIWAGLNGNVGADRDGGPGNADHPSGSVKSPRLPGWYKPIKRAVDEAAREENALYTLGLESQNDALKAELDEVDGELADVTEESLEADAARTAMEDALAVLRTQFDERGQAMGALNQKNADLQNRADLAETDASVLRQTNVGLADALTESQRAAAVLQEQSSSRQLTIDGLREELAQSKAARASAEDALMQLRERLDARGQEVASLRERNTVLQDRAGTVETENAELKGALASTKIDIAVRDEQSRRNEAVLTDLRQRLHEAERRNAEKEGAIQELQSQVRRLMNAALAPAD